MQMRERPPPSTIGVWSGAGYSKTSSFSGMPRSVKYEAQHFGHLLFSLTLPRHGASIRGMEVADLTFRVDMCAFGPSKCNVFYNTDLMMRVARLSCFLVLFFGMAFAQRPTEPRVLTQATVEQFDAPVFGYWGVPVCDRDGNLYFHGDREGFRAPSVTMLSKKGDAGHIFRVSGEYAGYVYEAFGVSPDGEVYLLFGGDKKHYVAHFDRNGSMSAAIQLDLSEHVIGDHFAVTSQGYTLVVGHFEETSPKPVRGVAYLGCSARPESCFARSMSDPPMAVQS